MFKIAGFGGLLLLCAALGGCAAASPSDPDLEDAAIAAASEGSGGLNNQGVDELPAGTYIADGYGVPFHIVIGDGWRWSAGPDHSEAEDSPTEGETVRVIDVGDARAIVTVGETGPEGVFMSISFEKDAMLRDPVARDPRVRPL